MQPPLRLGVIGCGYVATFAHLPVLSRLPDVDVVAVCDRDPERLAATGVVRRYSDADELIADPSVEAVGVFLPPADHPRAAIAALEAGKHVLVEKPLAVSLAEADQMVETATSSPGIAAVGFNLRSLDLVRRTRELMRSGRLGRIEALQTTLTSNHRFDRTAPVWRRRRELGGGSLIEQGIHHFDLWRFLLGTEVEQLFAFALDEDAGAAVTARTSDGVLLQTTLSERSTPTHSVEVFGTAACVRLALTQFDGFELLSAGTEDSAPQVRARKAWRTLRGLPRAVGDLRRGGHFARSYAAQWRAFAAAVRRGEPVSASFEDGRRALAISLAAAESASSGSPVRLAPMVAGAG
jgi:myo-inositol 2-dehydrogenase / D-chiro-inositol 1-dehydrogenase